MQVCPSESPVSQEKKTVSALKHQRPWPAAFHSSLSLQYPHYPSLICTSQDAHFTSLSLKSSIPLLNPSLNCSQKACFQTRPNSKFGDHVTKAMSFTMLSSVAGGSSDGMAMAIDADTGTSGDTTGSA